MHLNEDDLDFLGRIVDGLDNAAAVSVMPMSADLVKKCLVGSLETARDVLKAFLVERGFDPWS